MKTIDEFERAVQAMDAKLRPIAKSKGRSRALLESPASPLPFPSPLEAANIRDEADRAVDEIIAFFASADEADRASVRALFRTYQSFRWAAGWSIASPHQEMTADRFRYALVLFSIKDQGADWRDAIVLLDRLCSLALRAALPIGDMLAEVAALSSDEPRFKNFKAARSTRAMLLDYSRRFGNASPAEGDANDR